MGVAGGGIPSIRGRLQPDCDRRPASSPTGLARGQRRRSETANASTAIKLFTQRPDIASVKGRPSSNLQLLGDCSVLEFSGALEELVDSCAPSGNKQSCQYLRKDFPILPKGVGEQVQFKVKGQSHRDPNRDPGFEVQVVTTRLLVQRPFDVLPEFRIEDLLECSLDRQCYQCDRQQHPNHASETDLSHDPSLCSQVVGSSSLLDVSGRVD